FQFTDAFLEIGDFDPGGADRRATFDLSLRMGAALELAFLERQPALPAAQRGEGDDAYCDERCGGDDDLVAHVHCSFPFESSRAGPYLSRSRSISSAIALASRPSTVICSRTFTRSRSSSSSRRVPGSGGGAARSVPGSPCRRLRWAWR